MFRGSLLNEIIGPVMRGPSSSHTAAPHAIGRACRQLAMGDDRTITDAIVRFDPDGSFAAVYRAQGSDEGFAAGLLGLALDDPGYADAVSAAAAIVGFRIEVTRLRRADHPNAVELQLCTVDRHGGVHQDLFEAVSTGGGSFIVMSLNGAELGWSGDTALEVMIDGGLRRASAARLPVVAPPPFELTARGLLGVDGSTQSLAEMGIAYESVVIGLPPSVVRGRFAERLGVMFQSARAGLAADPATTRMRFLRPSARLLSETDAPSALISPAQQLAAAASVAVMEVDVARGIVVAAPTAGSAGILPGVLYALSETGIDEGRLVDALSAMALVGGAFAWSGTFAAECGGCAVETGAAAAMAAAGLVSTHGGSPSMAFDAASLVLVNTLGLVCDPVAGEVEIPCHARNIAGVAHAFAAASAVLGGFSAVLPFDEMAEMTVRVGAGLSADLRCTAKGGCAGTPTAVALSQRRPNG